MNREQSERLKVLVTEFELEAKENQDEDEVILSKDKILEMGILVRKLAVSAYKMSKELKELQDANLELKEAADIEEEEDGSELPVKVADIEEEKSAESHIVWVESGDLYVRSFFVEPMDLVESQRIVHFYNMIGDVPKLMIGSSWMSNGLADDEEWVQEKRKWLKSYLLALDAKSGFSVPVKADPK